MLTLTKTINISNHLDNPSWNYYDIHKSVHTENHMNVLIHTPFNLKKKTHFNTVTPPVRPAEVWWPLASHQISSCAAKQSPSASSFKQSTERQPLQRTWVIYFPGRYVFTIEILRLHYISQCCNYYKYGPVDGLLNAESMQVKVLLHADVRSRPAYDLETIHKGICFILLSHILQL